MTISYSAPGKILLSGEHAVVYGKPAIVSAVDRRLICTISKGYQRKDANIDFIAETVQKYLKDQKMPIKQFHYHVRTTSRIPKRRGMGSSAAFSVATVAAFLEFFSGSSQHSQETVNNLAYLAEKHFHKNPSGVDQTTSCFGGLVYFRKEFEFLKGIYKLNFKIPQVIEKDLYLVDSGKAAETTADMVALVGQMYNKDTKKLQNIFNDIEKVTKRITVAIVKEDKKFFDENIAQNSKLLIDLGIISLSTQTLLRELSVYGAGKVTGAGGVAKGSGFILFSASDKNGFKEFCQRKGIKPMKFIQSYVGLQRLSTH